MHRILSESYFICFNQSIRYIKSEQRISARKMYLFSVSLCDSSIRLLGILCNAIFDIQLKRHHSSWLPFLALSLWDIRYFSFPYISTVFTSQNFQNWKRTWLDSALIWFPTRESPFKRVREIRNMKMNFTLYSIFTICGLMYYPSPTLWKDPKI